MANSRIKLTKGWKKLRMSIDPKKFNSSLRTQLKKTNGLVGKLAERQIRDEIRTGNYEKNADLTKALKYGADAPLRGRSGELFKAVTSKVVNEFTIWVGVLRTDKHYGIAVLAHEGTGEKPIKVTPAMRKMFKILSMVSKGLLPVSVLYGRALELWGWNKSQEWKELKPNTNAIHIPRRPYMERALTNDALRKKVNELWIAALRKAFG